MKQYDVRAVEDEGGVAAVVILQSDHYADLPSVLVAPLIPAPSPQLYTGINPVFDVEGRSLGLKVEQTTAISRGRLGARLGSLEHRHTEILTAMDRLISGY